MTTIKTAAAIPKEYIMVSLIVMVTPFLRFGARRNAVIIGYITRDPSKRQRYRDRINGSRSEMQVCLITFRRYSAIGAQST